MSPFSLEPSYSVQEEGKQRTSVGGQAVCIISIHSRGTRSATAGELVLLKVFDDKLSLGRAAAGHAAMAIRAAVKERGCSRIVAATAASQMEFLKALTSEADIDWPRVEAFHHDVYIGMPKSKTCSFII